MTASGRGNGQQGGGGRGRGGPRERGSFKHLGRAIRYLGHYKRTAMIAYASLFLSTAAQLVVPQTVQNILDAVTNALTALEAGADPLQTRTVAETALLWAIGLTLLFAIIRGLFAFAQSYMAEKVSQEMAFDFRNDLFAKIQHLSFSYHDRNQTGQLMIRATDDVEKVRVCYRSGATLCPPSSRSIGRCAGAAGDHQLELNPLRPAHSANCVAALYALWRGQPAALWQGTGQVVGAQHHFAREFGRHQGGQSLCP